MGEKVVIILGASYAGLAVAHKLLKYTRTEVNNLRIILVSPTTHHYWNLASVRAIVPGQFSDDQIFHDILPGFSQYPHENFQFILGIATSLDALAKSVSIKTTTGVEIKKTYTHIVLATGSQYIEDLPWKPSLEGYERTRDMLHGVQEKIKRARSIAIGGAGPTGVEVAGELGFEYRYTKNIILISSGSQILPGLPSSVSRTAENEIRSLAVRLVKDTKVVSVKEPDPDGKTKLILSSGETILVDLYLPTTGVKPNTEYVPCNLKDGRGFVVVDDYLRVKDAEGLWAVGDVVNIQSPQLVHIEKQAKTLADNLEHVLKGQPLVMYRPGSPMIALTLGRKKATGRSGNMKIPGFMIWAIKGRTMFIQKLPKYVDGSEW